MEQSGEENIARFKQGEIFFILYLTARLQTRRLEIQQSGSDYEELGRLIQTPALTRKLK